MRYIWIKKTINNMHFELIKLESEDSMIGYYSVANSFLGIRKTSNRRKGFDYSEYLHTIVHFLNYLLTEEEFFFESDYRKIELSMAQRYIDYYCDKRSKDGDEISNQARKMIRNRISEFLQNMKNSNACDNLKEHYITRMNSNDWKEYELTYYKKTSKDGVIVIRKVPDFFIVELLEQARLHDIDCYMLIALQILAGLRPSEACNVRSSKSIYGAGYEITKRIDESIEPIDIRIDLKKPSTQRYLRKDGVKVGGIKRPRTVPIHPAFVKQLAELIESYELITQGRIREATGPLVTNKTLSDGWNKAITYTSYEKKFKKICELYVFPILWERGGIEREYVSLLQKNFYGPHMLREFFSCELVRMGCSWDEVMKYRGDKGEKSAITYVLKGGVFDDAINYGKNKISKDILNTEDIGSIDETSTARTSILPFRV
ncbi:site-specific integrase [Pseudobutyrivibrio sp. LB2011]|uniref:site-specific integrase n=1 Tax=Pseudobutyrivibrio sp. LB2011 TaxID=1408312 RepID=UPI0005D19573|nr:site-specific integrase [Pseudobutyrivibrio sp. LB2011]